MDITLLGRLGAVLDGVSVVPSAAKPRQILALLALRAGRVVTVPTLMEEIWGEDIPRSAATTLQTYILQLRRRIAAALGDEPARQPKDILVTQHGGYLLDVQAGHIDAQEFERLCSAGCDAHEAGDYRTAAALLRAGLDLWQEPVLVDVRVGSVLELETLRLDERRMAALERRIEADLCLGRYAEIVPELRVLVAKHPMHEDFCAYLMTALYRSNKAWRALDAYQRLRSSLVEELGLEPSPPLQRLHQSILSMDPETQHAHVPLFRAD